MYEISDNELVCLCLSRDDRAFEVLLKRYVKLIYSFVFRYINDSVAADDVTQEVFIRAWRSLKKFDQSKSFKTWLFTIAKNASLDFLKKKKAIPFSAFDDEEGDNSVINTFADPAPLPLELFERKNLELMLGKALEKLSTPSRMTLFLRYNDHLTFQQIAESTSESIDTVKSRHRRALLQLKKLLTEK